MITLKELNKNNYPTTPEIDTNLNILLTRLNKVATVYGKPMTVTSGLRSEAKQDELIAEGKSNSTKSKHLSGQAADILDADGALRLWILLNIELMVFIGFWFESLDSTPDWVHFQIVPPASGKLFFKP